MKPASLAGLLFLGLMWGASYLFIKLAVAEISPVQLVAARLGIAALVLGVAVQLFGPGLPRRRRAWIDLAVMSLLSSALPFTLIAWGEKYIDSGVAAVLNATTPFFTALLASRLAPDEALDARAALGIGVGFAGVALLVGPDALRLFTAPAGGDDTLILLGQLAVIAASFAYAAAAIWARLRLKGEPLSLAAGQMVTGFLWMIPPLLLFGRDVPQNLTWVGVISVVELGLLGTAFAYIIYYWLIQRVGAIRTTLVTYIIPVVGLILGAVFLGEQIQWYSVAGLFLVAFGIWIVSRRSAGTAR